MSRCRAGLYLQRSPVGGLRLSKVSLECLDLPQADQGLGIPRGCSQGLLVKLPGFARAPEQHQAHSEAYSCLEICGFSFQRATHRVLGLLVPSDRLQHAGEIEERFRKTGPEPDRPTQLLLRFFVVSQLRERRAEAMVRNSVALVAVHQILEILPRPCKLAPRERFLGAGMQRLGIAHIGPAHRALGTLPRYGAGCREPYYECLCQLIDQLPLDTFLEQPPFE